MSEIKRRDEVAKEDTWNLEDTFATDDDWEKALADMIAKGEALTHYQGTLHDAHKLYAFMQEYEAFNTIVMDVLTYAVHRSHEDMSNSLYQGMADKAQAAMVAISSKLVFVDVEILGIENIDDYYQEVPELKRYSRYISDTLRVKEHTLSAPEERLLAMSQEVMGQPQSIANMLMNADLKFNPVVDSNGVSHPLSNGSYLPLLQSNDRELRKQAFDSMYSSYAGVCHTLAATLSAQVRSLKFEADARHFNSTKEAALFDNNVDPIVFDNLIETVHENIHSLHKYMKLRKKLLGVDELHMYDLYVPMVSECDVKVPFEEAQKNCIASVSLYGQEYLEGYQRAFDERWIDKYENVGKMSGAYSSRSSKHPYMLLNYHDTLDSEFTLAHEMGHSMHTYLSNKYQNILDSRYVIFVAEVASTCNEALLMNYLRSQTDDKKVKAYLINYFLEQFRTTLYRQTLFAEFEDKINQMCYRHETMSAESFNKVYYDLNKFYYGDDVVVDEAIQYEWSRIPHFYMNYYVYQYSTGFSAAMALSQKMLKEGQPAIDAYLDFLKSGCTKPPVELLKGAGVDMSQKEPIQSALSLFDSLIDEMESLMSD